MAVEKSKRAEDIYKFPRMPHLHALVRISGLRDKSRRTLTKLISRKPTLAEDDEEVISPLEPYKETFKKHNWAFIENFFEPRFRDKIFKKWPKFYYFAPVSRMHKSYDTGFVWQARRGDRPQYLDHLPDMEKLYDHLDSDEFAQKVTDFCDDGIPRARYATLLTRAFTGSSVIPHRDSVATTKEGEHFLNFVIFVNGTGGSRGGGLCIMDGPEFEDIVFEPQDLVNTALVYRSNATIWHGFSPMRFGAFRWTINCQYCSKEWLENVAD